MKDDHFSFRKLIISFVNAYRGLRILSGEQSFMIQAAIGAIAIILGFIFHLNGAKFAILILTIGLVLSLEILNTIIENILDALHPKKDPKIGLIKDASGALVLVASFFAFVIGLILFLVE